MGKRNKRRRVSRDDVRKNAKTGGGPQWFNLPDGVKDWAPDKKGMYDLDIVPYMVSVDNHPDNVERRQPPVMRRAGRELVTYPARRMVNNLCHARILQFRRRGSQ